MKTVTTNNISREEINRLQEIEKKYKQLEDMVASFYPEDEDEDTGDLCDIGEKVCIHFGYL